MNDSEFYIAWYFKPPLWAQNEPDWDSMRRHEISLQDMMSEIVFFNDDTGIKFCRDGMLLLSVEILRKKYSAIQEKREMHIVADRSFTSFCLDYANAVSLLIVSEFIKHNNMQSLILLKIRESLHLQYMSIRKSLVETACFVYDGLSYDRGEFEKRHLLPSPECFKNENASVDSEIYGQWIDQLVLVDFEKHSRRVVGKEILDALSPCFEVLGKNSSFVPVLSVLVSVIDNYKHHLFTESIIHAWSIIEFFINKQFDNLKSSGKLDEKINKIESCRITAKKKSNILEESKIIDSNIHMKMDSVRGARNKIAHGFSYSNYSNSVGDNRTLRELCCSAFEVIQYLVCQSFGLDIMVDTSLTSVELVYSVDE